jgi:hypothetical protein
MVSIVDDSLWLLFVATTVKLICTFGYVPDREDIQVPGVEPIRWTLCCAEKVTSHSRGWLAVCELPVTLLVASSQDRRLKLNTRNLLLCRKDDLPLEGLVSCL